MAPGSVTLMAPGDPAYHAHLTRPLLTRSPSTPSASRSYGAARCSSAIVTTCQDDPAALAASTDTHAIHLTNKSQCQRLRFVLATVWRRQVTEVLRTHEVGESIAEVEAPTMIVSPIDHR